MTAIEPAAVDRSVPRSIAVATLFSGLLAALFGVVTPLGHPAAWALPGVAVGVALSELAVVHFSLGLQRWSISCTDALLALVLVLVPGSWLVMCVPAGMAVAQLVRRQAAPKIVFNVCQLAGSLGGAVYATHLALHLGLPRLTAAGLGMLAMWVIATLIVAVPVSASGEIAYLRLLGTTGPLAFVHTAASSSIGLLAAWLSVYAPIGLIALLIPVVLLWSSFDQTSRRSGEARLFAELARGQEQAGGGSVDASAQVVLTTAARLLGGADVSLLLFASDGLVRYEGNEHGSPTRRRMPVSTMQEPWIPEVLSGGVVLGNDGGAPYCGMRVGPPERPLALVYAVRQHGTGSFTRRDASLARVLVSQAETWLSVADLAASRDAALGRAEAAGETARALGDLGASTAPALAALRESASRLARLATGHGSAESVEGIVEELRAVEQAVASLLGAISLAADTDLGTDLDQESVVPVPVPATVPGDEWTSTGVLP